MASLSLVAADRIVAIATARGLGAVGVIRVSGAALADFALQLTGRSPRARFAELVDFLDSDGRVIDRGLLLYFPAPNSYTGEDVIEIQSHGGPVVMDMLFSRAAALGARPAEPGEFTRRAFLNGKIDLVQAESVADLIAATTWTAARSAALSLSGVFSGKIEVLSDRLVSVRAHVEAAIDFSDEEIGDWDEMAFRESLIGLIGQTDNILATATQGAMLREGIRVALVGRPNVGKSSLLNRLLGEDRAIVTDIAGTTRDSLAESLSLEGIPVTLVDTAGLRETDHPIERLGIERSWAEIGRAAIAIRLIDATVGETEEDGRIAERCPPELPSLVVANKIDLTERPASSECIDGQWRVCCSAKTGEGIDGLKRTLLAMIGWTAGPEGTPFIARERHLSALRRAKAAFEQALAQMDRLECTAEELRLAHQSLGEIVGEFSTEDLLGEIFSNFCIGK